MSGNQNACSTSCMARSEQEPMTILAFEFLPRLWLNARQKQYLDPKYHVGIDVRTYTRTSAPFSSDEDHRV